MQEIIEIKISSNENVLSISNPKNELKITKDNAFSSKS
jgi:hypothetical protein